MKFRLNPSPVWLLNTLSTHSFNSRLLPTSCTPARQWILLLPCPPPRPLPRLPAGPSGVLLACSAALALHTYDNTLGDTPPDILGLKFLISTLIVWLLIVLKATWLCFCPKREVAWIILGINTTNHLTLERLIGRSSHHLDMERLIGRSAYLILEGQICLPFG